MSKIITLSVPDWVDEKRFKEAFMRALLESTPERLSAEELRKLLGIKETEDEIEVPKEAENVRKKDRERIKWLS
ncbi:hypothetical protein [Thermococcus thioreducens]|uniref:Uncharacterized protein n=1 Tax=Thermococcus thioreducens TaxID=277988 RepID=A0A0Q2MSE0_9EURY|nr:hypothetical protein [Thermococcus thioreducens]ASJ11605.1 hypothetical protein A3L14_01300 [Thermococcus thioreducens]KQH82655.1 hypothetical protein AMR53_05140 [Thermococcus thioreducens]SEW17072.1 hypothetical protein SAMN05216170_2026 [Thermococcus thioreducens]